MKTEVDRSEEGFEDPQQGGICCIPVLIRDAYAFNVLQTKAECVMWMNKEINGGFILKSLKRMGQTVNLLENRDGRLCPTQK